MTEYILLKKKSDGDFSLFSKMKASSPASAIRAVALEDGVYVAVPKRSFRELPVKMKTETRAVVGGQAPKMAETLE